MSTAESLSFKEKVGYGLGDTASNFYYQIFVNFLPFFYTDVFGISAIAMGTMFFAVRIWDTLNDPMMGIIADRTRTRWGHFRPYLLWGGLPMAITAVAAFTTPDLSPHGRLIYAYVTYTLMMMAYTFVNIPYSALMGVMSSSSIERTSLSTSRFVLAFGGLFIVQAATLPLVKLFGGGNQAQGFQMTMAAYGVVATALFVVTFAATRERVEPAADQSSSLTSLGDDIMGLFENVPWVVLSIVSLFTLCYLSIRFGSILYYFKYFIGREDLATLFMVLGTVAVILAVLATRFLSERFGKRRVYITLMATTSILTGLFYFVPRDQIVLAFVVHILISGAMAPTTPLLWAMYADTADYSEWKTGRRATGLVFSAATFAQKLGGAVGGGLAGLFLAYFGFKANVAQSEESLRGIVLMMSLVPAALGILATVVMAFYRLDEATMESIEQDLATRRGATA